MRKSFVICKYVWYLSKKLGDCDFNICSLSVVLTGNGESGFDSGEGALKTAIYIQGRQQARKLPKKKKKKIQHLKLICYIQRSECTITHEGTVHECTLYITVPFYLLNYRYVFNCSQQLNELFCGKIGDVK